MGLEKYEYPASGSVSDSWLPQASPTFADFVNGRDLGIATETSAGNKLYAYGTALHATLFSRTYQCLSEADRAAFENFVSVVGGDDFRFTDERGVPHRVKFASFAPTWRDAFNDFWTVSFSMRGEMIAPPSLKKIPAGLRRDLLFYAPLTTSLGAFGRWNVTPSFVRGSTATYVDPLSGLIVQAANNTPRFEANGLLIEGGRTNLLLRSQEFDHAAWVKNAATIVANDTTAPDGTATADRLVESATTAAFYASQGVSITAGATLSMTLYAKASTRSWIRLQVNSDGDNGVRSWFNLSAGTIGTVETFGTGSGAVASIEAAANGFYRCRLSGKVDPASTGAWCIAVLATGDGVQAYAGDGSSGLWIWGAQCEEASFPSSYIPTIGAPVARAADRLSFSADGHALQAQGTAIIAVRPRGLDANQQVFVDLHDGTTITRHTIVTGAAASQRPRLITLVSGVTQADLELAGGVDDLVVGATKTLAITWQANDIHFFTSGVDRLSDNSASMPTLLTIQLGSNAAGGSSSYAHHRDLAIFVRPLTATELASVHALF